MTKHLGIEIDFSRDDLLPEQGKVLLTKEGYYKLKHETSPQQGFARAATAYCFGDYEFAQRIYDAASNGWFTFASPVLSNAPEIVWPRFQEDISFERRSNQLTEAAECGMIDIKGMPISCFLSYIDDTKEALTKTSEETRNISMAGGGIGIFPAMRSPDSKSTGVMAHMRGYDADALSYKQTESRRGSIATYMDINHPEILSFISMRDPLGGDPNLKCFNLNNGVNITDEFMHAYIDGKDYELIDPKHGPTGRMISAVEVWNKIMELRFKTGEPFIQFIDTVNRNIPAQVTHPLYHVRQSNLCFTGDTMVAVADGRNAVSIKELAEESNGKLQFPVYSGNCNVRAKTRTGWSAEIQNAVAFKSGTKEVIELKLSNGDIVRCTEDHEIALFGGGYVKAKDSRDCKLADFFTTKGNSKKYRHINSRTDGNSKQHRMIWKHHHGELPPKGVHIDHIHDECGDYIDNLQCMDAEHHIEKTKVGQRGDGNAMHNLRDVVISTHNKSVAFSGESNHRYKGMSNDEMIELARSIASEYTYELKRGTLMRFMRMRDDRMPYTLSKLRFNYGKDFLDVVYGRKEYETPSAPQRIEYGDDGYNSEDVFVVDIHHNGDVEDVYDLTVENNHNFYIITNGHDGYIESRGILVHNCSEITLMSSATRTAVCCLSSLNLDKYDEWKDTTLVADLVRLLDNVLEFFIRLAPKEFKRAIHSAKKERAIGLGTLGWHSFLQSKMIPFESGGFDSSIQWTNVIYSRIKSQAEAESRQLAEERGEPDDCKGSGFRNSHLMAIAPNASSSQMVNVSPSIEPWAGNAFVSKGRAGLFLIKNKYLDLVLQQHKHSDDSLDLDEIWKSIVDNKGSVQHLDFLTDLERKVFKTAREIDQRWIIEQASHRQKHICQSQSLNLFVSKNITKQEMSDLHFDAWHKDVKTLYYCRAESAVNAKVKEGNDKAPLNAVAVKTETKYNECLACEG